MQHLCKNIETLWQPFNLTENFHVVFFLGRIFCLFFILRDVVDFVKQIGNGWIEHVILDQSIYYFLTHLDKYNMYRQSLTLTTITCSTSDQINIQTSSRRKYPIYLQNQKINNWIHIHTVLQQINSSNASCFFKKGMK